MEIKWNGGGGRGGRVRKRRKENISIKGGANEIHLVVLCDEAAKQTLTKSGPVR